MEVKAPFWWLKNKPVPVTEPEQSKGFIEGEYNKSTNSLVDLFEREANNLEQKKNDVDIGSIIEEINRVAAQSPLGPYEANLGDRSVDEIMKEAEKVYIESSKSFEQLSQRSKTSQNISEISSHSTPTPKSISPLPLDPQNDKNENANEKVDEDDDDDSEFYSEDFSNNSHLDSTDSTPSIENNIILTPTNSKHVSPLKKEEDSKTEKVSNTKEKTDNSDFSTKLVHSISDSRIRSDSTNDDKIDKELEFERRRREIEVKQMILKDNLIKALEEDNFKLKTDIDRLKVELEETQKALRESKSAKIKSPDISIELEKALDELKDTQEINTALQMQLDTLTQTHLLFKTSQEDLINQNKNLEKRLTDIDTSLAKYKHELLNVQKQRDQLKETELSLNKLLDIEKIQTKSLKSQNESDAKCIQDLNRQIKEMERIITRKHPDSVSALIMAAKGDATDTNLTARKLLEERIRTLQEELVVKEKQSSQVYADIQDKFNQMKAKYENHIEDLELHVNDLKTQLKKKKDCFDIYTQTASQSQEIPQKESVTVAVQTEALIAPQKPPKVIAVKNNAKNNEAKSESYFLATIRGLQSDLSAKEKLVLKLQREIDELKRTNKRLQKEREGSLKNLNERKDFKVFNGKTKSSTDSIVDVSSKEDLELDKCDFEKIKQQLLRIEMDYQNLKKKRIHDLNVLQEAHELELSQYIKNLQPLREQLELQQLSINTLQAQLASTREELAIVTVERDHLNDRLSNVNNAVVCNKRTVSDSNVDSLQKKLLALERRYEEREHRLRAIVNGLAQKTVTNRNCDQCAQRQKQLISYKMELDKILESLRALK